MQTLRVSIPTIIISLFVRLSTFVVHTGSPLQRVKDEKETTSYKWWVYINTREKYLSLRWIVVLTVKNGFKGTTAFCIMATRF